jgi:signal transduction histidine kinase
MSEKNKGYDPKLLFTEWAEEIEHSIMESNAISVALFCCDGRLLFANGAMRLLFGEMNPSAAILNPPFTKLTGENPQEGLIYKGYMTFGDYSIINSSIMAEVYRKKEHILITGGVDSEQLLHQNTMMHNLNREISNLQREIIKEKHNLEVTLDKLNQTNKELSESNATKDKFFSIIAHDLKNPFNSLIGFSSYLKENINSVMKEELHEILDMIHQSSLSTYSLLEDLLMWSKSQLGKIRFEPVTVSFGEIWKEVYTPLKDTARKKDISLSPPDNMEMELYCDINMVKTILRNLISNAIKFSHQSSEVIIRIAKENNKAVISVVDHGIGMDKERLDNLWEIGKQVSTKGTDNESGSGLGLILCKEFTDIHNGSIIATSTPGAGSTFTFTLPYKK